MVMGKKILFVCLGNICRSPAAEGIMEKGLPAGRSRLILPERPDTISAHFPMRECGPTRASGDILSTAGRENLTRPSILINSI